LHTIDTHTQPQRALCFIKHHYPQPTFESTWLFLFKTLWTPPQVNITVAASLASTLQSTNFFTPAQVEEIMNATAEKEWKDKLLENTKTVLDQGAFGAPWMWVRNGEGKEEPFFGSDR